MAVWLADWLAGLVELDEDRVVLSSGKHHAYRVIAEDVMHEDGLTTEMEYLGVWDGPVPVQRGRFDTSSQ